jgi:sugar lactone lactonase YvrE
MEGSPIIRCPRLAATVAALLASALVPGRSCPAQTVTQEEQFRVKREEPFEFARGPQVTRAGDRVTVTFETKAFCDVTVAVEDQSGRIVRHLACGVLGPNAPEPFQKNLRRQTIHWDGKDDQGRYVQDKDRVSIRVSLGLGARFERHFRWSPHRRIGTMPPLICTRPEGVYVFDGHGVDYLRLFDHGGEYVRTLYPFPAHKLGELVGVRRHTFPQSGKTLPLKWGFYETTLLSSGFSGMWGDYMLPRDGPGATAMAIRDRRLALAGLRLNRLGTDGTTGGLPLEGPETCFRIDRWYAVPRSAALSPDGKTLYLAGFAYDKGYDHGNQRWIHGVGRIDFAAGGKMEVFAGSLEIGAEHGGSGPGRFKSPSSVDVDADGRVYVADHFNDRIQVFDANGRHLKSISIFRPSEVCIHQRTGHIFVFSWMYYGQFYEPKPVQATLTQLGPFEDPRRIASWPLPMADNYTETRTYADRKVGFQYRGAIDSWAPGEGGPNIWLIPGAPGGRALAIPGFRDSALGGSRFLTTDKHGNPLPDRWAAVSITVLRARGDRLEVVRAFGADARRTMPNVRPTTYWRDRLYVRPTTGCLYVLNHALIEINPQTGRKRLLTVPFTPEDMAFDIDGLVYLRTHTEVVRYNPDTWREVPFDYGEQRERVGVWNGRQAGPVSGALPIPTRSIWHQGGLCVSPTGHLAVAFYNARMSSGRESRGEADNVFNTWKPWKPTAYPGRVGQNIVRVWDRHGQVVIADAIPGLGITDGIAMDRDGSFYVLAGADRMYGRRRYWDYMTGTLVKFSPKGNRIESEAKEPPVPLTERPDRPADLSGGGDGMRLSWVQGAQWSYGGLYFTGKDGSHAMGGCACWNGRFAHDYFARSFAPETQHYTVAVLDKAGNLILRIGQYGNVDDGVPLVKESQPEIPNRRSLGGDEVGLFYPIYLATDSDRRLFITDPGNQRIVSVTLGYHTDARVSLKEVPDAQTE